MKKLLFTSLCLSYFVTVNAASYECLHTPSGKMSPGKVIFIYEKIKMNKIFYVPFAALADDKLIGTKEILLPENMTVYDLRDNKSIQINFKNVHDNVDQEVCRSISFSKKSVLATENRLFATQPLANKFQFNMDKKEIEKFNLTIPNACKPGQPKFDKDGITNCADEKLIAVSQLAGQTQFWHTKQYRYDTGFAIDVWDSVIKKFNQIAEDCSVCSD